MLSVSVEASSVAKGDQACLRECVPARAPQRFLNAAQTEARTRLRPRVANAHTEGVEFWEGVGGKRKGTYRKRKGHTYTSQREAEKY